MSLLKRQYWWVWLLLGLVTFNLSVFALGSLLKVYEKDAWYRKWYYWVLGIFCGIIPALVMFLIFSIQITIEVCRKLEVPGYEVYGLPYVWIVCVIIPVVGWVLFIVLFIYTHLWYLINLFQGKGEKYI